MELTRAVETKPMAGFQSTEIGMVPYGWKVVKLKSCVEANRSIRYGVVQPGPYCLSGPLMLRSQDYSKGWTDATEMHRVHPSLAEQYRNASIQGGDIIVTVVGANLGQVEQVPEWFGIGVLSRSTARVAVDSSHAERGYIKYYLSSPVVRRQILDELKEGAQPVLSCVDLGEFLIALPSNREEQRAIATALSDVDGLLAGLDALIAKKKALKQGAMQQLLTGKQRLPGFKGEWSVRTFGDLFHISGGYSASRDQLSSKGHPYLHYGDIHMSTKSTLDVEADYQHIPKLDVPISRVPSRSLLKDGDIVFVDASEDDDGVSKYVVIRNPKGTPFISGLHTIVASGKGNDLDPTYSAYCFQTAELKKQFRFYAVGTKVSGISKSNIALLDLPVPSLDEQRAIGAVLSDMDAELGALEARRAKTALLKQGMMQELLTGRVRLV